MSIIAKDLQGAASAKGEIRAGGTDLMDRMRHGVFEGEIVDISRISGIDKIELGEGKSVKVGALVSIHDFAENPIIQDQFPGLSMAAGALANPQIRRAGTLGGALLQRNRCWYYRHEAIACYKKGGNTCPMREGNHQFGVCFDLGPCVSPHPSTLGMALLAYDAEVEIFGKGRRSIVELYGTGKNAAADHLLKENEILQALHIGSPLVNEKAAYLRSISRARAEWPLVEVLVRGTVGDDSRMRNVRVVMGGVANIPLALTKVDVFLNGQIPSEELFLEAGKFAAEGAKPLEGTKYKVELVEKTLAATLKQAFFEEE